jgi:hypothetical protein
MKCIGHFWKMFLSLVFFAHVFTYNSLFKTGLCISCKFFFLLKACLHFFNDFLVFFETCIHTSICVHEMRDDTPFKKKKTDMVHRSFFPL